MLHRHRSNRMEKLVDGLAALWAEPAEAFEPAALASEWLVVPGRGMAAWLSMQLSQRLRVWADGACLYPRNFVHHTLAAALGSERAEAAHAYRPQLLTWAVAHVLPARLPEPAFARLRRYLEGDDGCARLLSLSREIADSFDRYLAYRPEWLLAWQRGDAIAADDAGEGWQAVLWRDLVERLGDDHIAGLVAALDLGLKAPPAPLPTRVALFGLSHLPPLYAQVVALLARHVDVHVFTLSPSPGFWTDSAILGRGGRMSAQARKQDPFIASLGALGAETEQILDAEVERFEVIERDHDAYEEPKRGSALQSLQAGLFDLQAAPLPTDATIAIHSCHGPMREVEVLRDQLRDRLEEGDLLPHQIAVLLPDVDRYAPLVEAVFERDGQGAIPYCIADRSPRRDGAVIDALLRILSLARGRFELPEVVDVLAMEPVSRRFGIAEAQVELCAAWLTESGVRWGIDAAHRAAHGQPAHDQNTWRLGLDRLLLGLAMGDRGRELCFGVSPSAAPDDAELLGRLGSACEALFGAVAELETPATIPAWRERVARLCGELLAAGASEAPQLAAIRQATSALGDAAAEAGFCEPIGVVALGRLLERALDEAAPERGFASGGVTFCAMVPMRAIPFELIAMLGMNDGAFPRRDARAELDLCSKTPRRSGDRSRRDDDRYLFLEALLSARRGLYLSYSGRSDRDGALKPPSPLVSELIERAGVAVLQHRLKAWSPAYFDGKDPRLFSYDSDPCRGARAKTGPRTAAFGDEPRLFQRPLGDGRLVETARLSVDDLARFFQHPVRVLMQRRLGIDLGEVSSPLDASQPIEPSPLERWQIGDELLQHELDGIDAERSRALMRAAGKLPPGAEGDRLYRAWRASASAIAHELRTLRNGAAEILSLDLRLKGARLSGDLELWGGASQGRIVRHQYGEIKPRHQLALWIAHLCQSSARGAEAQPSLLVGRRGERADVRRFRPVRDACEALGELIALYRRGLSEPLPFFAEASSAYARALRKHDHEKALHAAADAWEKERSDDLYLQRAFGRFPGDDPAFADLCRRILSPLFDHLEAT